MLKKTALFLMCMGCVMLAAAMALLVFNLSEDKEAGQAAEKILPSVISASGLEPRDETEPDEDASDDGYDGFEAEPYEVSSDMTVVEIDGYGYIGYLSIPALGLELPIMSEWDYSRLKMAPCRYTGSVKTGDLVICGHNYTEHFGSLKSLLPGDDVYFTDMDGEMMSFEVVTVEILKPTEISEMIESGYDLTLFTCTYGGAKRVTVRCQEVACTAAA